MGCNSDYMIPSERESQSKLTAQLLVHVSKKLSIAIDAEVKKAAEAFYGDESKLNGMVVALCSIISGMTEEQKSKIVYDGRDPVARKLADWWDRHEAEDKARIAREKKDAQRLIDQKQQHKMAESVLATLSDEQKAALKKYYQS